MSTNHNPQLAAAIRSARTSRKPVTGLFKRECFIGLRTFELSLLAFNELTAPLFISGLEVNVMSFDDVGREDNWLFPSFPTYLIALMRRNKEESSGITIYDADYFGVCEHGEEGREQPLPVTFRVRLRVGADGSQSAVSMRLPLDDEMIADVATDQLNAVLNLAFLEAAAATAKYHERMLAQAAASANAFNEEQREISKTLVEST